MGDVSSIQEKYSVAEVIKKHFLKFWRLTCPA